MQNLRSEVTLIVDEVDVALVEQITKWVSVYGIKEFGNLVKTRREILELSVSDLAKKSGLSKNTIARIELGEVTQRRTIARIARTLKFSSYDFPIVKQNEPVGALFLKAKEIRWHGFHGEEVSFVGIPDVKNPPLEFIFNWYTDPIYPPFVDTFVKQLVFLMGPTLTRAHQGSEILTVIQGTLLVKVDQQEFELNDGDVLAFDPEFLHSYEPRRGPCLFSSSVSGVRTKSPRNTSA